MGRDIRAHEKIFTHGCLAIMKERLYRDIAPLLLTYIGCCVVLTLLCIVSLVLASAYVAAINRRRTTRRITWACTACPWVNSQWASWRRQSPEQCEHPAQDSDHQARNGFSPSLSLHRADK